jgi:hypothetical protein
VQSPLRLSTSPRCLMLPGVTRAGYSAPDFLRGQRRQTSPHGAVTSGNAAAMAVRRGGSVRRKLLSARICGRFRITRRRRPWLTTMMLGAASMGRAAHQIICNVERTITTLACRSPFARPNSVVCPHDTLGTPVGGHVSEVLQAMRKWPLIHPPLISIVTGRSAILAYRGGAL